MVGTARGASLCRLWRDQGKQEEAHRMLAELYGWFAEGFDTLDLQEAKALLDQLAGSLGEDLATTPRRAPGADVLLSVLRDSALQCGPRPSACHSWQPPGDDL